MRSPMPTFAPYLPVHPPAQVQRPSQCQRSPCTRGFSLVELLVSIAISLVIVLAASSLFLSTRESQRTLNEKTLAFESARYALSVIGKDIENAGYYPAIRAAATDANIQGVSVKGYAHPLAPATIPTAYNTALFGCQAKKRFSPISGVCEIADDAAAANADADGLVINYYTNDAMGLNIGNRADCLRQDPANDASTNNIAGNVRRNAQHAVGNDNNTFLTPQQPLFVSNRYTLQPTTLQIEGQTIDTFSLACNGNGTAVANNGYQPLIQGIEQLRFFFKVNIGIGTESSSSYLRANAIAADQWANVVAVRVCLLARSLQTARLQGAQAFNVSDCDGTNRIFNDGVDRRVFSQVFAVKNNLKDVF